MIADPDLTYLRLAVHDLPDYLHSPVLYWPLPASPISLGEPGLQQLTLGGVAMSLARVKAVGSDEGTELGEAIENLRGRWAGTWSKKAAREFASRVDLWRKALNDLLDEPEGLNNAYPSRVHVRVMLELLITEMAPERPAEIDLLAALDGRLRGATHPGPFIWDACFISGFPPDQYWFLYVQFGQ